ncbi:MAG: hypothetical protein EXS64_05240 [Candidatus Latescibacteria bacterium]|nr:hypothetical protein [Candidatus Latescibacterota bacterium]
MSERLFNAVFYALRRRIRWSRPTYRPRSEDKAPFFRAKPHLLSAAGRLERRYHLGDFREQSTSSEYRESLYVLELMERFFPVPRLRDPVRALDVGSKNFAYARGLHHFFRHAGETGPRRVDLTGVEVDPYQIYTDLHSRYDYALYHIRDLDGCRYLAGDVMDHREPYDVITWFLPFVTEYALRKWGLPGVLFRPEAMVRHVCGLLAPGGVLVLASREEEERDVQAQLLRDLGVSFHPPERHESDWMAYAPRYVFVV